MISSRPLNRQNFLTDSEILSDTVLPPLLEYDVIYYFCMETPEDHSGAMGEIRTLEILDVDIKDMSKSKTEEGHAFIVDTGKKKYHLNAEHRFEMERWIEAIELSIQTSRERKLSITGACKNIAALVYQVDSNETIVRQQITDQFEKAIPRLRDWDDVESLLEQCTILKDDMITVRTVFFIVSQTFDACLALKPQRKDIIELYMKNGHTHLTGVLTRFWDTKAVGLNVIYYESLTLIAF